MFQVIKINFRNPLTGEDVKNLHFLGPAAFTKEEFEELRKKPLGEVITGLSIGEPEDPMSYTETDSQIKDLMDSIKQLREEAEEKSGH